MDATPAPGPSTPPGSSLTSLTLSPRRPASSSAAREQLRSRQSRQRPREKLQQLRAQVAWLERMTLALPLVHDADEIWDEFLDDDTKATRGRLRRLASAQDKLKTLTDSSAQLKALLAERSLAARTVRAWLQAQPVDDWELDVQRWKALARIRFKPWTQARFAVELEAALEDRYRFEFDANKYTSGLQYMGWEDSMRVLRDASALQFNLHKKFHGYDLERHMDTVARIYRDAELYSKVVLGGHARAAVDVLQELTPQIAIVMYHERYEGSEHSVHALNLIATVESDDCVAHYMRSIEVPEITGAFASETDVWVSKFYWMQYDIFDRSQPRTACDYRVSLRGTLEGPDAPYMRLWLFELLGALVRSEAMAAGRSLLSFGETTT